MNLNEIYLKEVKNGWCVRKDCDNNGKCADCPHKANRSTLERLEKLFTELESKL